MVSLCEGFRRRSPAATRNGRQGRAWAPSAPAGVADLRQRSDGDESALHNDDGISLPRPTARRSGGARAAAPRIARAARAGAAPGAARPRRHALRRRRRLADRAAARRAARLARRGLAGARGRRGPRRRCGAGLGLAQERAQLAAGEAARARLRGAAFARLLEVGPADPRGVGERASLVVDRVEALDGYFARWLPAATLAVLGAAGGARRRAALADLAAFAVLLAAGPALPGRHGADRHRRRAGQPAAVRRACSACPAASSTACAACPPWCCSTGRRPRRRRSARRRRSCAPAPCGCCASPSSPRRRWSCWPPLGIGLLAWHHAARLGAGRAPTRRAAIFALLLVPAFFAPLRAFSAAYHERLSAEGAAAALAPLLLRGSRAPPGLLLEEMPPRVVVTFTDVRLVPDPARPPALDGLSFRVIAGETLVLAGPSGAGKTSVLRLLMGFARPDGGRIAINGQDATALRPAELRRLSAYVGQRAHLFRATLAREHPPRPARGDGRGGRGRGPRRARHGLRRRPAAGPRHAGGRGRLGPLRRPGAARGAGPRLPARRAAGAAGRADRASRPRHRGGGAGEPAPPLRRPHRDHRHPFGGLPRRLGPGAGDRERPRRRARARQAQAAAGERDDGARPPPRARPVAEPRRLAGAGRGDGRRLGAARPVAAGAGRAGRGGAAARGRRRRVRRWAAARLRSCCSGRWCCCARRRAGRSAW